MDYFTSFIALCLATLIAVFFWANSATTIAKECEKLGSFYVNDKVYTCEAKK
jgi:hypothetical protein